MGIFAGGYTATLVGGYATKSSLFISMALILLTIACSLPVAFIGNFTFVCVLLWFIFFFTGSALPCMTGLMLNCVQEDLLPAANAFANLSYNIFGYLAGTFVYGFIYDAGENGIGRTAICSLMFIPILSLIFLYSSAYIIIRDNVLGFEEKPKE